MKKNANVTMHVEIGYGLIANAKFCKQLIIIHKTYIGKKKRIVCLTVSSNTHENIIKMTRVVTWMFY